MQQTTNDVTPQQKLQDKFPRTKLEPSPHNYEAQSYELSHSEDNLLFKNPAAKLLIDELEKDPNQEKLSYGSIKDTEEGLKHNYRNFLRSSKQNTAENGRFEYILFFDKENQKLKGLIYFGKKLEGPPGCAHGGSIASVIDACSGVLCYKCGFRCVTVNLNVNYKKFIALESVVLLEASISNIEGRKVFATATLKSLDGTILHSEGTSIWVRVDIKKE